jgi:hypothetical protein
VFGAGSPASSGTPAPATTSDGRTWTQLNLTEQSQIYKANPKQALAMAVAAGVPLTAGLKVGELPKSF